MFDMQVVEVVRVEELSPQQLVEAVGDSYRMESGLVAWRLSAVAALLGYHRDVEPCESGCEHNVVEALEKTSAEVSAALNVSPAAASYQVHCAEVLDTRLPRIAALLAAGGIDWRTVALIIDRTDLVGDGPVLDELDEWLAERVGGWQGWSRRRVINAIDRRLLTIDADAARERRRRSSDHRGIEVTGMPDGMAKLSGTVAAGDATAFDRALSQLAKTVCRDDPRTMAQRRADALGALTAGVDLACRCGGDACATRSVDGEPGRGAGRVVVNVIASAAALAGDSDEPAYIDGYGVIDAEQLRELAATAAQRLIDGSGLDAGALCYRPSAALDRAIRCRDLTCRFPGCDRPAGGCDIDHTVAFDHADPAAGGLTVPGNLKCLCRQHHRLKTHHGGPGGWQYRQRPDATVVWTSPTGKTYTTVPGGAELFDDTAEPAPRPRGARERQRSARIARTRSRNHVLRPINAAERELQDHRRYEIEARKTRNHMRDMLALFNGAPATSPFCPWINDPKEPEHLPPDWQPPPTEPIPDDPPF